MSSSSTTNNNATSALHILLSPDGYYTYLDIPKPSPTHKSLLSKDDNGKDSKSTVDKTRIEKNYRKKSLRLHPDRPGGDEEAFRILERAKNVLLSDKLRKEYDMIGLDLEEEDHHDDDDNGHDDDDDDDKKDAANSGSHDSLISQMASSTVAAILQLAVRTAMMAATSLIVTRYKYLVIPAILFMLYTSFQIFRARSKVGPDGPITLYDIASPMMICFGIICMYYGRNFGSASEGEEMSEGIDTNTSSWSKTFWMGEALLMTIFALNTLASREASTFHPTLPIGIGLYILFACIALYIRGRGWRYATFLAIELSFALIAVLVFPIMEMILEEIMNEKLRKVGERVRQYSKVMNESYQVRLEEMGKLSGGAGVDTKKSSRNDSKNSLNEMD